MSDEGIKIGATEPATPASAPEVGDHATVSGLEANVRHLTNQMQAMQSMHQQQMQAMNSMYSAMQQPSAHPLAPPSAAKAPMSPVLSRLEEDDPYFEQFQGIYSEATQKNEQLQNQVQQLQQSIQQLNMAQSRQTVQSSVENAMEKHQVPEELANDFRTVAYAYMASAQPGQSVDADHLVNQMMQNLGKYAEVARKKWVEEASKPKPLSVVSSQAGISDEPPGSWEEAKERSMAMVKAMMAQN